ncbi:MAG TPA: hypothetical protein VJH24_03105 [Candidatus Bilamarchaeaceae archaeon]|nr:hypothetical protein [Candidatus Bilamarchaeaceae archaeon]
MAVLVCSNNCGSKVESNRCCGNPMDIKGETLTCENCGKDVSVNRCCGQTMKEI